MSKPHVGHARLSKRFAQSSQNVCPQGRGGQFAERGAVKNARKIETQEK